MKKDRDNIVKSVIQGSIAEEAGIEAGDNLSSINGEKIIDIFDYRFLIANEELVLEVLKNNGEVWEIDIEKEEYEDLGIEFDNAMIDKAESCTNKCIFCFIDQLPKGMRETLYFKDDDSRLSFLTGNYVTLTNMNDDELDRIIKYRMSPINVSAHTTNPDLRVFMLKNRFAGDILRKIKLLVDGGITINSQIVLCRGVNDNDELDRTISDLAGLYPGISSISVVPVGITNHREGLCVLEPYDKDSARQVVKQVEGWQNRLYNKFMSKVVYLADELYIMAGLDIPGYEHYEDFPQIENGVGLVAMLKHEFEEYLLEAEGNRQLVIGDERIVSIATGVSAYKFIREMADKLESTFGGLKIYVYEIKNEFFGENVTVTGLLSGRDLAVQLRDRMLGEELLLCRCMLKAGEELFLDDMTINKLGLMLDVKVTIVDNSGKDFIDKALGIYNN